MGVRRKEWLTLPEEIREGFSEDTKLEQILKKSRNFIFCSPDTGGEQKLQAKKTASAEVQRHGFKDVINTFARLEWGTRVVVVGEEAEKVVQAQLLQAWDAWIRSLNIFSCRPGESLE